LDHPNCIKKWEELKEGKFSEISSSFSIKVLVDELPFKEKFDDDIYNTESIMTGGYLLGKIGPHKFKADNVDIFSRNGAIIEIFVKRLFENRIEFKTNFMLDHRQIVVYIFNLELRENKKFTVKFYKISKSDKYYSNFENRTSTIKFIETHCDIDYSSCCYTGVEVCHRCADLDNGDSWGYYFVKNIDRIEKYESRGYTLDAFEED